MVEVALTIDCYLTSLGVARFHTACTLALVDSPIDPLVECKVATVHRIAPLFTPSASEGKFPDKSLV